MDWNGFPTIITVRPTLCVDTGEMQSPNAANKQMARYCEQVQMTDSFVVAATPLVLTPHPGHSVQPCCSVNCVQDSPYCYRVLCFTANKHI